jgi:RHS repeat-associated protein
VGGRYELGGKELKRFQYDPANRLTTIYRVLTSGSTEYLSELDRYFYDSGANRIVKTQNGTGLRTYYLRDASGQLLSEFRRAAGETSIPEWAKDELYLGGRSFGLRENKRPGPPVGLHVSGIDPVQVEWTTNPESDVTGYNVYRRRVNLGESWGPVALGLTATAFVDEGAFPSGTNLNYQVTAVDSAGTESLTSPIAKLIVGDVTPPSKPTLGTPVAGSGQVTLSWSASSDSSGISGYEISRRASLEDPSVPITPVLVTTLNYLDVNLTNGTTYYYIVRAKDGAGNWGPYSCPSFPPGALCDKSAMPKDFVPPGPPKDFNATPLCPASGGQQFKLTWAPNPDSDNVTGYEIFRGTSPFLSSGNSVGTTTGTYYVDPSPTPGTRYYAVKALDNASPQNKSAFSDVRSGFTRDASISSAYPVTGPFAKAGDGKVTLTWDATTAPNLYRIYRKLNSFESCGDYQLVGQVAPPDLNFTDNTVSNNYAYDYSLVPVLSNAEGTFTRPALAIPLSRPGDSLEQCGREGPPTYSVKIKWAHPSTFRPYHPISANGLDAEEALFRGYHLYHYKLCGLVGEKGGGCSTAYWDNSPMRRVIVDADSVDPYLITSADASFEYVLGLTGSSDTDLWPQLVQEPGSYTAINGSDTCYPSPSSGALAGDEWDCRAATSKNCLMPRAVYDVFADGTWLSVESDWPDYWHPDEPISDQRCDAHFGTWGMTPQCWTVTTSPVAPTAVSVQATGEGQVSVSWTPGIQPGGVSVSQFYVYGQKLGGNGVPPFQRPVPYVAVGSSSSSYTFTNLPKYTIASPFTGYQFMVAAVDQFGRISSATASTHVVPSPESSSPGAPRGVRQTLWTVNDATRSDGRGRQGIKLAWTDAFVTSGAAVAGHRIYRSSTGSEPWCAFLQTGSLPSEPPLAPSLDRCEVASEALSSELTTGASVFYFWDKTAEASRNYYYRVTQVQDAGGVRTETPYTESPTLTGRALPYEPTRLPPVTGLRAWAPWNSQEKQGVNLDWCRLDASEDPGMPTIAGYNIYRTYLSGGPYHYLETVPASCLDTGKRCEIHVNPSNPVQYQVEVCDQAGANCYLPTCSESIGSCHVADRTFSGVGQRHPSPIDTPADQQTGFAFYYVVTATTSLSDPRNPANESQPSLENAGFPNYLGIGWYKRRDPDGDGDLLRDSQGNEVPLCGDQDSRFGAPGNEPGTIASAAVETGEVVEQVAPYRTIGQGSGYPPYRFLYYHLDHLGSVRVITDEAGAVVSQHHYLPFGEERPGTIDPSLNTRAFTGHERDADTGMDYMLARYYSSSLARFLSPDQGGDTQLANPQSWNKYVYTGNNPLNYVDPNGQFKILVGEYRHENVTRAALPASGGVVNRADVIRGNRGGDLHRGDLGNHLNTGGAATGSAGDTRVQHGSSQLGEALRQVAGGNTQAAGETLGNAMHSFDDLMAHGGATGGNGGDHSSPANAGNMDSSDSPGIATRFEGAVSLESSINGIFTQAATAIQAGGDADAIIAGAQEQAAQAAQGQYSSTKAQLDKNGSKPQGY